MTEQTFRPLWWAAAAAVLIAAGAAGAWGGRMALGVFAGGAWNLASLWCLTRLLSAWLWKHASRRHIAGWLLLKFPLLYLMAFGLLRTEAVSLLGFGLGFSVVLTVAIGWFALRAQRMVAVRPHGR